VVLQATSPGSGDAWNRWKNHNSTSGHGNHAWGAPIGLSQFSTHFRGSCRQAVVVVDVVRGALGDTRLNGRNGRVLNRGRAVQRSTVARRREITNGCIGRMVVSGVVIYWRDDGDLVLSLEIVARSSSDLFVSNSKKGDERTLYSRTRRRRRKIQKASAAGINASHVGA
jgi:hypothetical protein